MVAWWTPKTTAGGSVMQDKERGVLPSAAEAANSGCVDAVLGDPYRMRYLPVRHDPRGPTRATLIHRGAFPDAPVHRPAILMLHGWSDYIFQRDILEHLHHRGCDVWALDLRRHGRSLDPHQPGEVPTAIDDLDQYDEELFAALSIIGHHRPILLLAHSTGGLTAARFAQRYPGRVDGLILNSPWFAFHLGDSVRRLLAPLARTAAQLRRDQRILPHGTTSYVRATHRDFGGSYDFDLAWKPSRGHPFPASTFAAVLAAQGELRRAGQLAVPTLVLHSQRSDFRPWYRTQMQGEDVILDVHGMHRAARRLGPRVEVVPLAGAVHDVFLSAPAVVARALAEIDRWLGRLTLVHRYTQSIADGEPLPR